MNKDTISPNAEPKMKREKGVKCTLCNEKFAFMELMKRHTQARNSPCEHCKIVFCNDQLLDKHKENVHKVGQFQETKSEKGAYECRIDGCTRDFYVESTFHSHQFSSHKVIKCGACGKTFENSDELRLHLQQEHSLYRYKCDTCDRSFNNEISMKKHQSKMHGILRESAKNASDDKDESKMYEISEDGELIQKIKKEKLDHECDVCNKGFSTKNYLKAHKKRVHKSEAHQEEVVNSEKLENPPKKFTCSFCREEFEDMNTLKNHAKLSCNFCKAVVCNEKSLNRHVAENHFMKKPEHKFVRFTLLPFHLTAFSLEFNTP